MFCMHCGQQLPDDARFCSKCGNKTLTEQNLNPASAPQPVPVGDNGSHIPAISNPPQKDTQADGIKDNTKPGKSKFWANKATRYITLGVLALLLIAIIIVAIPSIASICFPDSDYFGASMSEEDENERSESDPVSQEDTQSSSLKNRDPAVLPDFAAYDSSNSYKHYVTFLSEKEPILLCIGYESSDTDSTYAVQDYMNALFEMGYKLDEEHSYKSTFANMPSETFYLYHPDIPVSFISGTNGQIKISYNYTSNNEVIHVYIRLPEAIVIEGFETAYATEKAENEAEAKRSSSSSASSSSAVSSSGGSSRSGTASVDRSIYDVKSRCGVCGGDGDCNKCGGDGKIYSSASKKEDRNCTSCSGRGNCRSCGGDGWVGEG